MSGGRERSLANLRGPDGKPRAGFEVGNVERRTHGFRALVEIERSPRTAAIADEIEAVLPIAAPGDEFAVWLLAGMIERRIRGLAALADPERSIEETRILRRDLSTVENSIARMLDALGLTPRSRAALGLDVARAEATVAERLRSVEGAAERAEARIKGET